jgi:hypothetical protein
MSKTPEGTIIQIEEYRNTKQDQILSVFEEMIIDHFDPNTGISIFPQRTLIRQIIKRGIFQDKDVIKNNLPSGPTYISRDESTVLNLKLKLPQTGETFDPYYVFSKTIPNEDL